jgi:hypothetical protein
MFFQLHELATRRVDRDFCVRDILRKVVGLVSIRGIDWLVVGWLRGLQRAFAAPPQSQHSLQGAQNTENTEAEEVRSRNAV